MSGVVSSCFLPLDLPTAPCGMHAAVPVDQRHIRSQKLRPLIVGSHVRTAPGMAGMAWLVLPFVWSQGMGHDQGLPGVVWRRGAH